MSKPQHAEGAKPQKFARRWILLREAARRLGVPPQAAKAVLVSHGVRVLTGAGAHTRWLAEDVARVAEGSPSEAAPRVGGQRS